MLKEFFDAIVQLGQQAKTPVKLEAVDRERVLYAINGEVRTFERKNYLDVRTHSLASFIEVVSRELENPDAAMFVDVSSLQTPRLVGVMNTSAHEGSVVMPLVFSKPFLVALAHRSTQRLTQAQLVRLLKVDLIDFVDPTVVDLYRRLNVVNQGQMQAEVKAGAVRGMQSFSQEAQTPPPDTVAIATPVFQNGGERDHKTIRFSDRKSTRLNSSH